MKLLASNIQSLFTATAHIHCYRRAIEELVYNALDAKATSIAIRIHIQGESIQVIDNGTGVRKTDMSLIGLKHMTSKTIDKTSLQSAPNTYGYRGQALSCIIEVTKTVKITSRAEGTSDTFVKVFYKGKEKDLCLAVVRPSKGTTIEIQGLLYNLKIQKANINPLQEIQEIKQFLEKLSLVHQGISISLRDDSKNEIIFKIHKSRDLYQTMETLFDIDRGQVQELKVEKKEYKITAFIGKKVKDDSEVHWIFLNGRFITSSKLNEIVDRNMEKALCLRKGDVNRKKGGKITEESNIYKNRIPFYLIFLSCPYNDYDINFSKKQVHVEFRNWDHIRGFVDKLVKFYVGDNSLKLKKDVKPIDNGNNNTKEEVKKIVEKFLASNSKRLGISQTRNGLKGKLIKRIKNKSPSLSKMSSKYKKKSMAEVDKIIQRNIIESRPEPDTHQPVTVKSVDNSVATKVLADQKSKNKLKIEKPRYDKLALKQKPENTNINNPKGKRKNLIGNKSNQQVQIGQNKTKNELILAKNKTKNNKLLKAFKKDDCKVKKRCKFISEKARRLMKVTPKQLTKFSHNKQILFSQAVQYTQVNGAHSVSMKKTIRKTYKHKAKPNVIRKKQTCFSRNFRQEITEKSIFKDPVIIPDNIFRKPGNKVTRPNRKDGNEINTQITQPPGLTFQSHNYEFGDYKSHDYYQQHVRNTAHDDIPHAHFITTKSTDNFNSENRDNNKFMHKHKSTFKISRKDCYPKKRGLDRGIFNIQQETSYTIEFTNTMEEGENGRAYSILRESLGLNNTFDARGLHDYSRRNDTIIHLEDNNEMSQKYISQHNAKAKYLESFINIQNVDVISSSQNVLNNSDFEDYTCISYKRKRFDINNYYDNDNIRRNFNGCEKGHNNAYSPNQTYDVVETQAPNETMLGNVPVSKPKNEESANDTKRMNVLFLSNTQESVSSTELHPLNFCETLLGHSQSPKDDNNKVNLTDELIHSKSKEITIPNELLCDSSTVLQVIDAIAAHDTNKSLSKPPDETSHHFQKPTNDVQSTYPNFDLDEILNNLDDNNYVVINDQALQNNELITKTFLKSGEEYKLHKETGMAVRKKVGTIAESNFDIKNRPCFLPKGLSPIYENCNSKKQCDFAIEDEYFNNTMYEDFAKNIEMNVELFKPNAQNIHEMATKNIEKVNARIQKDNASLCFDGSNLKDAKILGQVDNKFIAAKLKTKTSGALEHLVLFDQHAVHERIRLENNLNEYVTENQWKSVKLDEIVIKLAQDDILYLHNYREKFYQLGLNWSNMSDREVCINAIPEAILGKNPRQVDIIMKAVKSLILEEIESLKLQKGSLKLYPKAIMDLVFSEACRYAIKFGDPLSKDECIKLLKDLCKCKSPFQCAHGRPVMAVVMDIKPLAVSYKIDIKKLNKFKVK